jgi:hypothetical protein
VIATLRCSFPVLLRPDEDCYRYIGEMLCARNHGRGGGALRKSKKSIHGRFHGRTSSCDKTLGILIKHVKKNEEQRQ